MIKSIVSGTMKTVATIVATTVVVGTIMAVTVPSEAALQEKIHNVISTEVSNNIASSMNNGISRLAGNVVGSISGTIISNIVPVQSVDYVILKVAQVADNNGPVFIGAFNRWWLIE